VGGTVLTAPGTYDPVPFNAPAGQTFHGGHAYVQYQIPPNARRLPLVLWHGGGQMGKCWESTPDGREGYQTIFLRRGFSVYILDQPSVGRAGNTATPFPTPPDVPAFADQGLFMAFRLGPRYPEFYPGVQFPRDPESMNQYLRQTTPTTGPGSANLAVDAVAALFGKIGEGVLVTHSASGGPGWRAAIASDKVRAVVSYEPVGFVFPDDGTAPAPLVTPGGTSTPVVVPLADFKKLTRIPIQLVFGDNIPTAASPYARQDLWFRSYTVAKQFVDSVNAHGGDAQLLHLPEIGVYGNTHFPFSDLNNLKIADLLSEYLTKKKLDGRDKGKGNRS
jgi:hypothetical protein